MSFWKKALMWLWLLTKRLYKKPSFLAIILLIPLLVFGYRAITREDSGIVTVALAYEEEDPVTQEIIDRLLKDRQVIRYIVCDTPERAKLLVQTGKADTAWVFPENILAHIQTFLEEPHADNAFMPVYQREENAMLSLAREKLGGELYHHMAQLFYLRYTRTEFPELTQLPDQALLSYYDGIEMTDTLFHYNNITGAPLQQVHYLMTPVRGLLAVVIALCSLATAMYYCKDRQAGTFDWVPQHRRAIPELGCQLVAVLNVGAVVLLALILSGIAQNLFLELGILLLYSLCIAGFSMLLRVVLGGIRGLGAMLPVLLMAMFLVCPIFFDLSALRLYALLLPPTYYVNAAFNPMYILYMAIHTLLCFGLYFLLRKVLKRA